MQSMFVTFNSDCLYLTVSAFHSAPDLAIAGLIDSVTTDPVLLSAVQPTEASMLQMRRCCFCLSLYAFPSFCKNDGTSLSSKVVSSGIAIGSQKSLLLLLSPLSQLDKNTSDPPFASCA